MKKLFVISVLLLTLANAMSFVNIINEVKVAIRQQKEPPVPHRGSGRREFV